MILSTPDGRQYGLQLGENIAGRSSDCGIRIDSPRTSRHHAKIEWDGSRARIMDLGSTNGTLLNGRRLETNRYYPLNEGDRVDFGSGPCSVMAGVSSAALPGAGAVTGAPSGALPGMPPAGLPSVQPLPPLPAPLPGSAALGVVEEAPRRRLSTPLIVGLAAILVVALGLGIWWGLSRTRSQEAAQRVEPTLQPTVAVQPTSTAEVRQATSTPAAKSAGAGGAAKPAVPAKPPAGAPGVMPPINATTMPNLVQQFLGGIDPNLVSAMLGGTPMPGLTGGSPAAPGTKRYAAPKLMAPASGSNYQGEDAVVVLEWEPVQSLAAQDYYWVMVFYKRGDQEQAGGVWMKGTSYRVPAWFLKQAQGRFEWRVVMVEATGLAEQGGKLVGTVSDPSERRWFEWRSGGQAPAPNPGDSPIPTPTYGG